VGELGGHALSIRTHHIDTASADVVIEAPEPVRVGYALEELARHEPRFLAQRLERALHGAADLAARERTRAQGIRAEASRAAEQRQAPFDHQDRLRHLQARLREVDQALAALTDPAPGVEAPGRASPVATPAQPGPAPTV